MSVSIHEDRKIRMKNLHFEHLQTDFDSESKVLVTVEPKYHKQECYA